jgi:hypothetical protein
VSPPLEGQGTGRETRRLVPYCNMGGHDQERSREQVTPRRFARFTHGRPVGHPGRRADHRAILGSTGDPWPTLRIRITIGEPRDLPVTLVRCAVMRLEDILNPGGTLLGRAGTSTGIRVATGDLVDAVRMLGPLTPGGIIERTPPAYPGIGVRLPGGGFVGLRPVSQSDPPTIDVNIPSIPDRKKVKFVKEGRDDAAPASHSPEA